MTEFLSEESIGAHREYLRGLRLKYSILEKSVKTLENKNIAQISRQNIPTDIKREALDLRCEIELHDVFFASFTPASFSPSLAVTERFGSVGALLNELYRMGMAVDRGFVCVGRSRGVLTPYHTACPYREVVGIPPLLALDVCEHAYFSDYGFDKRAYLLAALPHLALSRLDTV